MAAAGCQTPQLMEGPAGGATTLFEPVRLLFFISFGPFVREGTFGSAIVHIFGVVIIVHPKVGLDDCAMALL